ncbi:LLM class flavin-dependent oxidoreductase [Paraburkholderia sprentiae WSM5005]|uniref:LLM class flavin-dependent oxidoreductase n=1 Tax=Paraburkholderia sprentiae WSM5005 TaxID=754502 RepID=A0A8F4QJQ1_9BURK|nr:LLM class flavin-dependent oxidoreductase [Paraburkholderia sprentiae WSM5005]
MLRFHFIGISERPYVFARRISTLDQLTDGRVAWNVVTSYLPAAMGNLGVSQPRCT